jgi:hypothetical protein
MRAAATSDSMITFLKIVVYRLPGTGPFERLETVSLLRLHPSTPFV